MTIPSLQAILDYVERADYDPCAVEVEAAAEVDAYLAAHAAADWREEDCETGE